MEKTSPLIEERRKKADTLRDMGVHLYPAGYKVDMTTAEAVKRFGDMDEEALKKEKQSFSMAGRIMAIRGFGKASFIHIKDGTGRIQAQMLLLRFHTSSHILRERTSQDSRE